MRLFKCGCILIENKWGKTITKLCVIHEMVEKEAYCNARKRLWGLRNEYCGTE